MGLVEKISRILIGIITSCYIASDVIYAEPAWITETSVQTGRRSRGKRFRRKRIPRQRQQPHNHNHEQSPQAENHDGHNHSQQPQLLPQSAMPSPPHECRVEPFAYKVDENANITQIETPKGKIVFSIDENGALKITDLTVIQPYIGESAKTICNYFDQQKKQGKILPGNITKFLSACQTLALISEVKTEQPFIPHVLVPSQTPSVPSIEQQHAPSIEPRRMLPPASPIVPESVTPPKIKPQKGKCNDGCCD
jgi:hypothetical protein